MRSDLYPSAYFLGGGDSNYVDYSDDPGWLPSAVALRRFMSPQRSQVLEVGCATGWFVRAARSQGLETYGVDVSAWAISHPAPEVETFIAEQSILDVGDGDLFDAVVSWEVLEHVPEQDVSTALRAMCVATRSGGLQVHRIALKDAAHDHDADGDATHVTIKTRNWWLERFAQVGGLTSRLDVEAEFDAAFTERDWAGRFFAFDVS